MLLFNANSTCVGCRAVNGVPDNPIRPFTYLNGSDLKVRPEILIGLGLGMTFQT